VRQEQLIRQLIILYIFELIYGSHLESPFVGITSVPGLPKQYTLATAKTNFSDFFVSAHSGGRIRHYSRKVWSTRKAYVGFTVTLSRKLTVF
jgi:hypothetical protein